MASTVVANELQYYANPDTDTGQSITAKVYDDAAAQVGSDVACSEVGSLAIYQGDMPTASAGVYTVRFFESSSFVAQGTIEWDGSVEITGVSLNDKIDDTLIDVITAITDLNNFDPANDIVARVTLVDTTTDVTNGGGATLNESDIHAALTSFTGKDGYKADISSLESRAEADAHYQNLITEHSDTQTQIASLNDVTTAEIEAALLDENDGSQILNAIVNAIGNQNVDEIALVSAIRSDLERANGTLDRIDNASVDLTPVQDAITALNDFDPANDTVARVTLVDTTTTNTDMRGTDNAATATRLDELVDDLVDDHTATQNAIAALNDLSSQDVTDALIALDVVINTDLSDAITDLETHIDENAGLNAEQASMLTFIRDLAEADESYTAYRATKFLKGTSTILLDKDVDSTTVVDVTTTVTEYETPDP